MESEEKREKFVVVVVGIFFVWFFRVPMKRPVFGTFCTILLSKLTFFFFFFLVPYWQSLHPPAHTCYLAGQLSMSDIQLCIHILLDTCLNMLCHISTTTWNYLLTMKASSKLITPLLWKIEKCQFCFCL